MGGGKSTTMFVAEYFFDLAGGLVISMSGRDFTIGSKSLSALTQDWLAGIASDARKTAILRSISYTASPSSSLLDLIAVAAVRKELSVFIFEEFISQLQRQKRYHTRRNCTAVLYRSCPDILCHRMYLRCLDTEACLSYW